MWKKLLLSLFLVVSSTQETTAARAITDILVPVPRGYIEMCRSIDPSISFLCEPSAYDTVIPFSENLLLLLRKIKQRVNHEITYRADITEDRWNPIPNGYGDCEDYVLSYKIALAEEGIPPDALRIAIASVPDGGIHAVLLVVTDQGNLVLDLSIATVNEWQEPLFDDYTWILTQEGNLKWVLIDNKAKN